MLKADGPQRVTTWGHRTVAAWGASTDDERLPTLCLVRKPNDSETERAMKFTKKQLIDPEAKQTTFRIPAGIKRRYRSLGIGLSCRVCELLVDDLKKMGVKDIPPIPTPGRPRS